MEETAVMQDTGVVKGNIVGVLCYLGGILSAVLLIVLVKDNKFVRFHAMQSIITFVALFILGVILSISWVLLMLTPLLWLLGLAIFIFLMYKAYQGEKYKLPVIGDMAEKNA